MKYLHFPASLAHTPIRLNKDEQDNPISVIKEFFTFYTLNHTRLELGKWLEYAMLSADPGLNNNITRTNLLQFSYQLEALIEAIHILHFDEPSEKSQ